MAKRHLEQYDKNGNMLDIYLNEEEVMVGDQTLAEKLADMEDDIDDAAKTGGEGTVTGIKVGSNTYEPTDGVVDISNAVPTSTSDLNNNSDFTTKTYVDAAVQAVQTALAGKISGIKANGASETLPVVNGIVELPPAGSTISPATNAPIMDGTANVGSSAKYAREDHVHPKDSTKLSKSDVSVETQGDGTVTINVDDDTYTIDLKHNHPQYVKAELKTQAEYDALTTKDSQTLYIITDAS